MPNPCDLAGSPRLQAVVRVLLDGAEHSTLSLIMASRQCAVDSAVRELRNPPNNLHIERSVRSERSREGHRRLVHYYRLGEDSRRKLLLAEAHRMHQAALAIGHQRTETATVGAGEGIVGLKPDPQGNGQS